MYYFNLKNAIVFMKYVIFIIIFKYKYYYPVGHDINLAFLFYFI